MKNDFTHLKLSVHQGKDYTAILANDETLDIATARFYGHDELNAAQNMALAKQMAAGPELLKALQFIVDINGSSRGPKALIAEFKHVAATAIAKATAP